MYKILTTLASAIPSAIPEVWLGTPTYKIGHVTLTAPLLGVVCRP